MKNDARKTLGVYVHVPFCLKKCAYCDFYSQSDYSLSDAYIEALLREAAWAAEANGGYSVDTVYIGGGTPSSLSQAQLKRLLNGVLGCFSLTNDAEITLEANPATLDEKKMATLRACGVNRLSIGLQSASDQELKTLSRLHTYDDFCETYRQAKRYWDNISLDLMFGLPDQTLASFEATLKQAIALSPTHLSVYALKIEEGTPFYAMADRLRLPSEDAVSDMYLYACDFLETNGYLQYEISNFARQGCFSRHNLRYWRRGAYIGLGPGAHSFIESRRYANARDLPRYLEALSQNKLPPRTDDILLSEDDRTEEEILLRLRLKEGLNLAYLYEKTGYAMEKAAAEKLSFYETNGFLTRQGDVIALTPKGFLVSNTIIASLLP